MQKLIQSTTPEELLARFPIELPHVEGRYFAIKEITPGVWRVDGRDIYGREVGRMGADEEALLRECASDARAITASVQSR